MAEPEKAFLKFEGDPDRMYCQFNPEKFSMTQANSWKAAEPAGGKPLGKTTFNGQQAGTMSLTLTFDTTKQGTPVTTFTSRLLGKMEIDPKLPGTDADKNNARPPWVQFFWGRQSSFPAVIDSANVTFEYFSSSGVPLRAQVVLSLTQYMASRAFSRQNPTSGTPEPHRVHRVQRGETLDRISAQYYGDSTMWRKLAVANGIEDPLGIRPGSLITIPQPSSG